MDRSSRLKTSKDIIELHTTTKQQNIVDTYRLHHPTMKEYTFFTSSQGTLTKIYLILGQNTHLNNFKRIEIIQSLLSNHSRIKQEINNRKISEKI